MCKSECQTSAAALTLFGSAVPGAVPVAVCIVLDFSPERILCSAAVLAAPQQDICVFAWQSAVDRFCCRLDQWWHASCEGHRPSTSERKQKLAEGGLGICRLQEARTCQDWHGRFGRQAFHWSLACTWVSADCKSNESHVKSKLRVLVGPRHQNRVSRSPAIIGSFEWVLSSSI